MTLGKRVFLIGLSCLMVYISYSLIDFTFKFKSDALTIDIFMAIFINICITEIFAFSGFALPTYQLLPKSYYVINNSRSLKNYYHNLKVNWFHTFLLGTFWKKQEQRKKFFNGKRSNLDHFIIETKKAEFGHLIPFILINLLAIVYIAMQLYFLAIFTVTINVIFNFYPIILQRYHRMRIQMVLARMSR